ncbi:hypothetical protein BKA93DRAFT_123582 [Sparassis latifolia]
MPLQTLPADILFEVARYLANTDVLHLSVTSWTVYAKLIPAIYAVVDLRGAGQCNHTLSMLQRYPHVARHVRRLVVRPERRNRHDSLPHVREWDKAGMVSRLVVTTARYMDVLQAFEWDGEDMLPDDRMWVELRLRCPLLKSIGVSLGCFLPRPTSNLFQFNGLVSFSLTMKDGFYAHQLHVPSRESEPLFTRLLDMLTRRCPDLESLSIAGTSNEIADASLFWSARWPRLRLLELGDVISAPEPFLTFLEAHPTLEGLYLLGRPRALPDFVTLNRETLPSLCDFAGSLDTLRALLERGQTGPTSPPSPLAKNLHRLCVPDPMQLRELTPLTISHVLVDLQGLTSLELTFAPHSGHDSNSAFRTIVAACPQLLNLKLTCVCKPSFYLESFSRSLRNLTRLRTFALTIVPFAGEEPMYAGAARMALANPRLHSFSIAYIPYHTTPRPLPRTLERANFELLVDTYGIPVGLRICEWRARLPPWKAVALVWDAGGRGRLAGWRSSRRGWTRQWVNDLRQSGHPDATGRGWAELLLERSPAGEEARMLMFCFILVVLIALSITGRVIDDTYNNSR